MAKKTDPFIKGLMDKYRQAVLEDRVLVDAFEKAKQAWQSNKETKDLCAALLRKQGIDPDSIEIGIDPAVIQAAFPSRSAEDGPLNDTHAVYLTMKKRGNVGLTVADLIALTAEDGTPLTAKDVNKVIWTQLKKKRMEKLDDGRIRLTALGEQFNNFRRKLSDDEIQGALLKAV